MIEEKTYYQNEPLWVLEIIMFWFGIGFLLLASIVIFLIDVFIGFKPSKESPSLALGLSIVFLILSLSLVPYAYSISTQNIHINNKRVWMSGDIFLPNELKTQKRVNIYFSEITSVTIWERAEYPDPKTIKDYIFLYNYKNADIPKRYIIISTSKKTSYLHASHFTDSRLQEIIKVLIEKVFASENTVYNGKTSNEILFGPGYNPLDSSPE